MPTTVILYMSVRSYILGNVPVERWFVEILIKRQCNGSYPVAGRMAKHRTLKSGFQDTVTKETLAR